MSVTVTLNKVQDVQLVRYVNGLFLNFKQDDVKVGIDLTENEAADLMKNLQIELQDMHLCTECGKEVDVDEEEASLCFDCHEEKLIEQEEEQKHPDEV